MLSVWSCMTLRSEVSGATWRLQLLGFLSGLRRTTGKGPSHTCKAERGKQQIVLHGAWDSPCPSMGWLLAGTGSASISASLFPRSWHTDGVPVVPAAGRHTHSQKWRRARADSSPLGGDLAAHQVVCRALYSQQNHRTRPTGGTNAMGATKCNRSSTTVPLQGCSPAALRVPALVVSAHPANLLSSNASPMGMSPAQLAEMMSCPLLTLTIFFLSLAFDARWL